MNDSYTSLLLEILSIMRYADKEKFTEHFEEMNRLEAIAKSVEQLPQHVQDELLSKGR